MGKQSPDILFEDLCFDTQQAAEKALKSLMAYFNIDIPKSHSIGFLLKIVEDTGKTQVPVELKDAAILTDYAVTTRYPGDWEPVTKEEYEQAVALSRDIYQWVLSIIEQG